MTQTHQAYAQLEARIIAWASEQPDLRAIVVVGSRARRDHTADEWSDLDLIVFSTEPTPYVDDPAWLSIFGEVWIRVLSQTGRGDPEWLVLYAGGLKVDWVLVKVEDTPDASVLALLEATPYHFVYARGARVLVNTLNPTATTQPNFSIPPPTHPSQTQFHQANQLVLLDATRVAKLLRREDVWRAKYYVDSILKQRLLTLLEWHAHATYGLAHDTWHDGRYLDKWADPRALAALPTTFARYDGDDLWRALFATLDLYGWLAAETAQRLGYDDPAEQTQRIIAWLLSIQPPKE